MLTVTPKSVALYIYFCVFLTLGSAGQICFLTKYATSNCFEITQQPTLDWPPSSDACYLLRLSECGRKALGYRIDCHIWHCQTSRDNNYVMNVTGATRGLPSAQFNKRAVIVGLEKGALARM